MSLVIVVSFLLVITNVIHNTKRQGSMPKKLRLPDLCRAALTQRNRFATDTQQIHKKYRKNTKIIRKLQEHYRKIHENTQYHIESLLNQDIYEYTLEFFNKSPRTVISQCKAQNQTHRYKIHQYSQ